MVNRFDDSDLLATLLVLPGIASSTAAMTFMFIGGAVQLLNCPSIITLELFGCALFSAWVYFRLKKRAGYSVKTVRGFASAGFVIGLIFLVSIYRQTTFDTCN